MLESQPQIANADSTDLVLSIRPLWTESPNLPLQRYVALFLTLRDQEQLRNSTCILASRGYFSKNYLGVVGCQFIIIFFWGGGECLKALSLIDLKFFGGRGLNICGIPPLRDNLYWYSPSAHVLVFSMDGLGTRSSISRAYWFFWDSIKFNMCESSVLIPGYALISM